MTEPVAAPQPMTMQGDDDRAPPETALAGLSAEQKKDVLVAHEHAKNGGLVAILVPLGSFVFLLGAVALILAAWVRVARERQLTVRHAIDKGVPPSSLVLPPNPFSDRRRGILLVAVGVGLGAVVGATSEWVYATVGVLPLAVGAGYLINFRLQSKAALPRSAT